MAVVTHLVDRLLRTQYLATTVLLVDQLLSQIVAISLLHLAFLLVLGVLLLRKLDESRPVVHAYLGKEFSELAFLNVIEDVLVEPEYFTRVRVGHV